VTGGRQVVTTLDAHGETGPEGLGHAAWRTYTFNVVAWVFGEAHGGVGTASIAWSGVPVEADNAQRTTSPHPPAR
jgi:hypothetical protein